MQSVKDEMSDIQKDKSVNFGGVTEKHESPRVAVLMSTYNGEKYIREQLDSILRQKNVQVVLYIRDDGSSDHTFKILLEYAERYPEVRPERNRQNMGPGGSFLNLFYELAGESGGNFDYLAFADQDDIWLPDKLSSAIRMIEAQPEEKRAQGILYGSNQWLYENGSETDLRFHEVQDLSLEGHLTRNTISGCTMVMNRQLALRIGRAPRPSKEVVERRMHDSWVILAAIVCGSVIYDPEAHILYRIHSSNVVGVRELSLGDRLRNKWKTVFDRSFTQYRSRAARQLLVSFPDVSGRKREILEEFADYQKSAEARRRFLHDAPVMDSIGKNHAEIRMMLFFHLI